MYTDDVMGCWKGKEEYWKLFEPEVCNLNSKSVYSEEELSNKNIFFKHMI
jgi:hypothetical protein